MAESGISEAFVLYSELNKNILYRTVLRKSNSLRNQKVEITAACSQDASGR